jgi:hypothetical protein
MIQGRDFYESFKAERFTVRKNVFEKIEPIIPYPETGEKIFNQPVFSDGNKRIALWDFKDANKYIDARYLWPDGQMRHQCYWSNLHKVNK